MSYFALSKEQYDLYDGDKKVVRGAYLVSTTAKKYASVATRKLRDGIIDKERKEFEARGEVYEVSRGD